MQQIDAAPPRGQRQPDLVPKQTAIETPWIERRRVEGDDFQLAARLECRDKTREILADPRGASAGELRIDADPRTV